MRDKREHERQSRRRRRRKRMKGGERKGRSECEREEKAGGSV